VYWEQVLKIEIEITTKAEAHTYFEEELKVETLL
jgi:hypothetical protein